MMTVLGVFTPLLSQNTPSPIIDLSYPQEYRIAGISVLELSIRMFRYKTFSSLQIGAPVTIPGEDIGQSYNESDQDLFADISIEVAETRGADIYLVIRVEELPRLTRYSIAELVVLSRRRLEERLIF